MEQLTEVRVKEIIKEEFNKNYFSGATKVPPHQHNNVDNLPINLTDVTGVTVLDYTNKIVDDFSSFLGPLFLNEFSGYSLNPRINAITTIPAITTDEFQGGRAAIGTLVLVTLSAGGVYLYVCYTNNNNWKGIELTLAP